MTGCRNAAHNPVHRVHRRSAFYGSGRGGTDRLLRGRGLMRARDRVRWREANFAYVFMPASLLPTEPLVWSAALVGRVHSRVGRSEVIKYGTASGRPPRHIRNSEGLNRVAGQN